MPTIDCCYNYQTFQHYNTQNQIDLITNSCPYGLFPSRRIFSVLQLVSVTTDIFRSAHSFRHDGYFPHCVLFSLQRIIPVNNIYSRRSIESIKQCNIITRMTDVQDTQLLLMLQRALL